MGGHRKVPMADLRALHTELDHSNVSTYIQSGNVVFDCETGANRVAILTNEIKNALQATFGFDVHVILRSPDALRQAAARNPFAPAGADPRRVAIAFLDREIAPDLAAAANTEIFAPDVFEITGLEIQLHCPNGFGTSKLNNTFLERTLQVSATTRNWNTVGRLIELGSSEASS